MVARIERAWERITHVGRRKRRVPESWDGVRYVPSYGEPQQMIEAIPASVLHRTANNHRVHYFSLQPHVSGEMTESTYMYASDIVESQRDALFPFIRDLAARNHWGPIGIRGTALSLQEHPGNSRATIDSLLQTGVEHTNASVRRGKEGLTRLLVFNIKHPDSETWWHKHADFSLRYAMVHTNDERRKIQGQSVENPQVYPALIVYKIGRKGATKNNGEGYRIKGGKKAVAAVILLDFIPRIQGII